MEQASKHQPQTPYIIHFQLTALPLRVRQRRPPTSSHSRAAKSQVKLTTTIYELASQTSALFTLPLLPTGLASGPSPAAIAAIAATATAAAAAAAADDTTAAAFRSRFPSSS